MVEEIDKKLMYAPNSLKGSAVKPKPTNRKFLYAATCTGNLMALSVGISLGWTSPVNPKLNDPNNLINNPFGEAITKEEESWIGSLLAVGGIFGPFVAGFVANRIGRKKALILCGGIPSLLSYLLLAFGPNVIFYYIGRFLAGFTAGSVYTTLPNFNSEIAEDSNRGALSSSINFFAITGTLFSYIIGPYTSIMWFSIICAIIPATFLVIFSLFVPESPYYLIKNNDLVGAMESLTKFRSNTESEAKKELETMKIIVEESMNSNTSNKDIWNSKPIIKAFIISLTLVGFQQLSGIAIVLFYFQSIFEATESSIPSEISTIIVGSVQVAASLAAPLLVDRMGRKFLLAISAIGMVISEVPLGLYFYLKDKGEEVEFIHWLPIVCLICYVVVFHTGFGPLPWTVMAELFPPNIKDIASTATTSFCWVIGFVMTKYFSSVVDLIGMAGSFWLFSGFCCLAAVFVLTYFIETKGKSVMEIQAALAK